MYRYIIFKQLYMKLNIVLEQFKVADFKLYFELVSDESVMEMITERALPLAEAQVDFAKLIKSNALDLQYGSFKIIDRDTGDFIGLAKLEIEELGSVTAELGYMLLPEYWGKGIGSLIAKTLIEKAQQRNQLQKLVAIIDPKNSPSRKILVNNRFESVSFEDFDGLPGEILELKLHR